MAKRSLIPLLLVALLAMTWASPGFGLAQTPQGCIPMEGSDQCLPTAPESKLVDTAQPVFSDPTHVTNPLNPISQLESVVLLGRVERLPFRTEVTLLPETKTIELNGQQVEVLVSQYAAYLDGRITEVAIDLYAQADDGSVWYLGEDVYDYEDGVVSSTEGTWHAGVDGPAAMIMPANPQAGDVYRPENIPGIVYEEVSVISTNQTVTGPQGPTSGAIVNRELHQDGTTEGKIFAPGYGEFLTGQGGELEALALSVPTDALSGPPPAELETLTTGALSIFDAAESEDWTAADTTLDGMLAAWETYEAGDQPPLLENQMSTALVYLVAAVDSHQPEESRQAAIEVARAGLDFELRHRPVVEIDLGRFDLMARQVLVDAAADDAAGITSDVTTLEWMWDRVAHSVDQATADQIESQLTELRTAADDEDVEAAVAAAAQLQALLAPTINA
jgi:hypothetical protein